MTRPERPSARYQGRTLPRPEEDLADQGLAFDLATLLDRRSMLRVLGLGVSGWGLAACSASSDSTGSTRSTGSSGSGGSSGSAGGTTSNAASGEIPEETSGPYPGDGSNGPDVLEQSGVVRRDIRSSFGTGAATAQGVPLTVTLRVADLTRGSAGMAGAAVYIWHCNREGEYSLYSSGLENENYLRGVQIADADGNVSFTSIYPGCYSGRWPHIHFEIYPDEKSIGDVSNSIATSQIAFPEDACDAVYASPGYEDSVANLSRVTLAGDTVFGDDSAVLQLGKVSGDLAGGYTIALDAAVDTTTAAGGGAGPGGGDGRPNGEPPGVQPPS